MADLTPNGQLSPNWAPHWSYLLSVVQVHTTTHCMFYREQHWAPHVLRPALSTYNFILFPKLANLYQLFIRLRRVVDILSAEMLFTCSSYSSTEEEKNHREYNYYNTELLRKRLNFIMRNTIWFFYSYSIHGNTIKNFDLDSHLKKH
jgi:hypothetical protein